MKAPASSTASIAPSSGSRPCEMFGLFARQVLRYWSWSVIKTLRRVSAHADLSRVRALLFSHAIANVAFAQTLHPDIARACDHHDVPGFELPLAQPDRSPHYLSAAE